MGPKASSRGAEISVESLLNLVEHSHFEAANEVRLQLLKRRVTIPPDPIYLRPACHVLRQPNYLKLGTMFEAWITLYPEAEVDHQNPFQEVTKVLFDNPETNLDLIYIFGRICATKGYSWMVKNSILPLMKQYGKDDSMLRALEKESFHRDSPSTREHQSESTVFAMVNESLPLRLPEFIPNEGSIFEVDDADYEEISDVIPLRDTMAIIDRLTELLEQGRYSEARHIMKESVNFGIHIPFSPIFEKAARYALGTPLTRVEEPILMEPKQRLEDFSMWMSLVPLKHDPNAVVFKEIMTMLFSAVVTHMDLIARFGLICAEKGYSVTVSQAVIPAVMRYVSKNIVVDYVRSYEMKNKRYYETHRPEEADPLIRKTTSFIRGLAVRHLMYRPYIDGALALLPRQEEGIKLSAYTFDLLIARLNTAGSEYGPTVRLLTESRSFYLWEEADTETSRQLFLSTIFADGPNEHSLLSLPQTFRYIARGLRSNTQLPHSLYIMYFIDACLDMDRPSPVATLRRLAWRKGYRSASVFATAELLRNYHRGFHLNLIRVFVQTFYVTGVPREDIFTALQRLRSYENVASAGVHPAKADLGANNLGRLFPNPIQCSLVWHSLVALSVSTEHLEALYTKLLNFANGHVADQLPSVYSSYADVAALVPPRNIIEQVAAASFTPFIRPLMLKTGLERGARILGDMTKAGLKPDVYQFAELAGTYARKGYRNGVFFVLNRMERHLDQKDETWEEVPEDFRPENIGGVTNQPKAESEASSQAGPAFFASSPQSDDAGAHLGARENTLTKPPDLESAVSGNSSANAKAMVSTPGASSSDNHKPTSHTTRARSLKNDSLPPPSFVMYVSLLRGFIMARDFEAAHEINRRLHRRFTVAPGDNEYLDNVYADWSTLQQYGEAARYPSRVKPSRIGFRRRRRRRFLR